MATNERDTLFIVYEQMKRAHDTLMSMSPTPDRDKFSTHLQHPIIFLQQSLQLTQKEIDAPVPPTRLHTLGKLRDCKKMWLEVDSPNLYLCSCETIRILTRYIGDPEIVEKAELEL